MPPRGDREQARGINPPQTASGTPTVHIASSSDHSFYLQTAMEIQRSIGKLETSVEILLRSSDIQQAKLDSVSADVILAKGGLKLAVWLLGIFGSLILLFLTVILHHFKML